MSGRKTCKQLRVFVSSTFNDMREERSLLVGKVFPLVADYCHARKLEFIGVDLRWGVSEEQSRRGETVAICMAEIDRCRPLFIGMIGQRYGWVPDGSPVSVTEQEMLYGALDAPEDTEAFFYLRDPALTEALCGPSEADARLDDLKERIRASRYPVLDGYRDLDSFGRRVYEDLTALVDRIASRMPETDPTTETRLDQFFLAERCAAAVVARPEPEHRLRERIRQGGLTLLTGEPGAGKTALLAKWAVENRDAGDSYTFLYFIGSAEDKGWERLGRQLVEELRGRFHLEPFPLETKEDIRRAIHIALGMASKHAAIILAIDQIDALALDDGFGLSWLPEELPEHVSAVLTLDAGDALDRLRLRPHAELCLDRLSPREVGHVAEQYLIPYGKTLSLRQLDMLRQSEPARTPLYLITLLDEIRHVGRHNTLTEQMEDYLSCGDARALFEMVLQRIDREHAREGSELPRRMLSLLEASRGGLTEGELLPMLGPVPPMRYAPLRLALEAFTAVSGGALHIAVPEFREAVRAHYGLGEPEIDACRKELIGWFQAHPDTPRRAYILPWLLRQTGDREGLLELLSDPACFAELWERNKYETKAYWTFVRRDAAEGYRPLLSEPERYAPGLLLPVAELLTELGNAAAAQGLLTYLVSDRAGADDGQRGQACGLLGNLYQRAGRLSEAERLYTEKLTCAKRQKDLYEQQRAMGNLGLAAMMRGELAEARAAFENVLSLAVSLNQRDAQQVALGNLGNIAFSLGDMEKARAMYERQKSISLDSGNAAGLINAHGALGVLFSREKEYDAAEREFLAQEEQSRKIGAADGLANALGNRAALAQARGERETAERLLLEKLAICRETGQFLGEQNALGNLFALAWERGDLAAALDYGERRVRITRENRAFRPYAEALYRLSEAERETGRDEDARLHRLQAETVAKQHGFTIR